MHALSRLADSPRALSTGAAGMGFVGSALVTRASYVVGSLPGHHPDTAVATGAYRWPYEIGVAMLVVAWLALGRLVLDPAVAGMSRRVCWAGAAMAAPLLAAAPVTSQDVWAYLGQGNVAAHGLDPYAVGPTAVPGPFSHAVAHEWVGVPSAYGPAWVWISRSVVDVVQPHPWAGMFVLRMVAVAGVVVTGLGLARLCRATGQRPEVALWLALAGPFPFVMLLGAIHNEAVMLPLMVGGVAVAATSRSMWRAVILGGALVGLAAAVKVTALLVLPFLPLVWRRYAAGPGDQDRSPSVLRRWVVPGAAATVAGAAVLLLAGVASGLGLGWVPHVGDGRVGVRWLSLPQQVGHVLHVLAPGRVADLPRDRYSLVHPLGLGLLAVSLAAVAATALRRPPLRTLGWVMVLLVVTSPAPRVWYLLWPLVFVAAERTPRRLTVAVAAASAALVLWFPPSVRPPVPPWVLLVVFVPLLAVVAATAPTVRAQAPERSSVS